jgi:hypothetical protein
MAQIILGLLAVTLGLWGLSAWWFSVEELLRGLSPLLLILVGVAALMAGLARPGMRPVKGQDDQDLIQRMHDTE